MIQILKILTVISGITCIACDVLAADYKTNKKRAPGYEDLYITVTNENNQPVSNAKIITLNTKPALSAVTDANGLAVFQGKCREFANIGRNYSAAKRNNQQVSSDKYPVRIKVDAENYNNVYGYLQWDDFSGLVGCERSIKFTKKNKRTYPKAANLQYAFNQATGKVKFLHVCEGQTLNGTKTGCVHAFKDTNVQYLEGAELAKQYMLNKVIPETDIFEREEIQCEPLTREISNDDYLACTSTLGHYAYDFQFDDLIESADSAVMKHISHALCEIINDANFDMPTCKKTTDAATETMCPKLNNLMEKFSWSAHLTQASNGYKVCEFDFAKADKSYKPRTVKNAKGDTIDIYRYENIEVRSVAELEFLLHQFTKTQIGNIFYGFSCTSGFRQWDSTRGARHIFECYVTTTKGTFPIDFVFADVNIRAELRSNAGLDGMTCIASGGSFDGAKCHGLTKEQCLQLNGGEHPIPGGAEWDAELAQCVLKDATKQANIDQFVSDLKTVGEFALAAVGATLVIIATGGTGAPAVIALVGAGLSMGGQLAEQTTKHSINDDINTFVMAYDKCKQESGAEKQHYCAYYILNDFYALMSAYTTSNRLDDLIGNQKMKSLDEVLVKTLEMIIPENLNVENALELYQNIKPNKSKLVQLQLAQGATITGDLILIFVGGAQALQNFSARAGSLSRVASAATKAPSVFRSAKVEKVFGKLADLKSSASDFCKSNPTTSYCPI